MKKLLIILTFLIACNLILQGQSVSKSDSLKIYDMIRIVFVNFENPNFEEFEKISTSEIYCNLCVEVVASDPNYNNWISRVDFFNEQLIRLAKSELWESVQKASEIRYHVEPEVNRHISDITVLFTILQPDEVAKGHEGAQAGLHFKNINGEFKFAGIETIP